MRHDTLSLDLKLTDRDGLVHLGRQLLIDRIIFVFI